MTLRGDRPGCRDLDEVDVCYVPYLVNGSDPIKLYASPQRVDAQSTLDAGRGFCRVSRLQTARAGSGCSRNLLLRDPEGVGLVFGYANTAKVRGWVEPDRLQANLAAGGCCGPADADYRCGEPFAAVCSGPNNQPCDGELYSDVARGVSGRRRIDSQAPVELRYAPGSTTSYFLPGTDSGTPALVEQTVRVGVEGLWTCVTVIEAYGYAPNDTRGWIFTENLGPA